jgi:peptidoglycan hydrolase-like protein with peptidoglycan-binding domain
MANWKDLLRTANVGQCLDRARIALEADVIYVLGKGGFDPTRPLTKECDCSGFVAWAIGIPREFPPGSGRWLDTDAYWSAGGGAAKAAGFPLLKNVSAPDAEPGDVIVYPDQGGSQGHIGIISGVDESGEPKVIHCSKGNWKNFNDATRETNTQVWKIQNKTRILRIDFDAMRRYAGVTNGGPGPVIDVPDVAVGNSLRHSLLATDPTLQLVAAGKLVLSRTGKMVSGIAPVQQAMNILARERETYAIDLGPNEANSGVFGPRTDTALKALQADLGLPETGEVNAFTLAGLDGLLVQASAEVAVDDDPVEVETVGTSTQPEIGTTPLVFDLKREGTAWYASTLGERFYVGNRVPYEGRLGLMNTRDTTSAVYDPAQYAGTFGFWAYFINPTARAESNGRFNRLNSYDSAGFTFGFLQFAAHVAEGDFVKFFRALLQLDERAAYFPELQLHDGHIVQTTSSGLRRLETSELSEALKRYLNPSGAEVEPREVLSAARFIHWSQHSQAHRDIQVKIGVETAREKLRQAQKRMALDGRSDKVCFVVMDILHQGRGKYAVMKPIVENNNDAAAYEKLLSIGAADYAERIATIRAEVKRLVAAGHLGTKRYVAASNDFV